MVVEIVPALAAVVTHGALEARLLAALQAQVALQVALEAVRRAAIGAGVRARGPRGHGPKDNVHRVHASAATAPRPPAAPASLRPLP